MWLVADVNAVSVIRVTKAFPIRGAKGSASAVVALQDISLEIPDGHFVSLVGPSGCGKTTLLRLIGGLEKPTAGDVVVHRRPDGTARRLSFVFQDINLLPWRSVLSNVGLGLEGRRDISKSDRESRCMAALEMVGLADVAKSPPYTLSGGMQQRVGLARALAVQPDVLLMDEPFGALDNFTRETLQEDLARLWEGIRTTVVFVTHDIDEAIFLSTEIALFSANPGHLISVAPVSLPPQRWTYDVRSEEVAISLHRQIRDSLGRRHRTYSETGGANRG
jgi:NitT/TauT family transport system ATP-binding protein